MSHKYYGFQKDEQDSLYAVPFLSTKVQRLRFLNEDFVGYADQNEFIIHNNPGLTILRVGDNQIIRGLHNRSNTNKLMSQFLNNLIQPSYCLQNQQINSFNQVKIKEVKIHAKSSIQIKINAY